MTNYGHKLRLSCAALIGAAVIASPAAADTLIDNIQGITIAADGKVDRFTGLWIDDDGIIKLVLKRGDRRPSGVDFLLDGKGQYVIPGMIDAHAHVMGIGFGALTLDLSETTSLTDAQAKIAAYAAANPNHRWIIGRGWNQEKWNLGRFPTAADLDAVVADRPVWLERVDGHAGWANSAAMKLANVTAESADPIGGRIERMAGSKKPSGAFIDGATAMIDKLVPPPRPEDRDLAFQKAQSILLRNGITSVADMGTTIADWQTFRRSGDNGTLNVRIMSYASGIEAMEVIGGPGPSPWLYGDRLKMEGVKLYLDGALGSRGAWLKKPYSDDTKNVGLPFLTASQLRNLMSRAALDRFQIAVHAIGDAANSELLQSIDDLAGTYTGDRRWRVEHAQIVDPVDLALFAKHGIIASMQPVHQTSDRTMAEARLGPDRLKGAYAWHSIAEAGSPLAFGSDAPVEAVDPFAGLAAAFTRMDKAGQPFGGWQPQERVSRELALTAFTYGGAYAGFAEGRFGRLLVGERADFLLVDHDPLLATVDEVRATKVLQTWVGGKRVFDRDADASRR